MNELTYDDNYLEQFQAPPDDEELLDQQQDVNPLDLCPRLDMGRSMSLLVDDEPVINQPVIFGIVVYLAARRALWTPDSYDGEWSAPLCTTGVIPVRDVSRRLDRAVGFVNSSEESPYTELVDGSLRPDIQSDWTTACGKCPLNRFKSAEPYAGRGGGKACSERRIAAVLIVQQTSTLKVRGQEIPVYGPHPDVDFLTIFDLSSSSIGTVASMQTLATRRRTKLSNMVFSFSADEKSRGKIKWNVLKAKFSGYPDRELAPRLAELRETGREILFSMNRRQEDDEVGEEPALGSTEPAAAQATAEQTTPSPLEEEIPF